MMTRSGAGPQAPPSSESASKTGRQERRGRKHLDKKSHCQQGGDGARGAASSGSVVTVTSRAPRLPSFIWSVLESIVTYRRAREE